MIESQHHPDLEKLLQLVDDSAPSRSNRWVRKHVAACWKCRSHLEELQDTVREFARYHEKVLLPNLPAPPHPWPDLRSRMRQIDEADPLSGLFQRAAAYMSLPAVFSLKRLMVGGLVFSCVALAVTLALKTAKPSEPAPAVSPSTPANRPAAKPAITPASNPAGKTVLPATIDNEVGVFAALHQIGADLGDPIDISSDGNGHVNVTGIGLASPRQAEVRDALASLPDVAVTFPPATPAPGTRESKSPALSFEAGRSPFEAPLQQFLGGQSAWENYANQVLDESDAVLTRAHALQTLAEHFPPAKRAGLRVNDRTLLEELMNAHRTALREHARALESLVAPVREALHAPAAPLEKSATLLASAQRMDRVLSVIFGVASTTLTPAQLLAELSQASAGLQDALGRFE